MFLHINSLERLDLIESPSQFLEVQEGSVPKASFMEITLQAAEFVTVVNLQEKDEQFYRSVLEGIGNASRISIDQTFEHFLREHAKISLEKQESWRKVGSLSTHALSFSHLSRFWMSATLDSLHCTTFMRLCFFIARIRVEDQRQAERPFSVKRSV